MCALYLADWQYDCVGELQRKLWNQMRVGNLSKKIVTLFIVWWLSPWKYEDSAYWIEAKNREEKQDEKKVLKENMILKKFWNFP